MNYWRTMVNSVYSGMYYMLLKYEPASISRTNRTIKMMAAFFMYYFALVFWVVKIKVSIYGPYKPHPLEPLLMFGLYVLLYNWFVKRCIDSEIPDVDVAGAEKKRKMIYYYLFCAGGVMFFFCSIIVSNYL